MPSLYHSYEVLLDFSNDTQESITIQLVQDYGRNNGAVVLLRPSESITLVLESGNTYRYAVKCRTKVINIAARGWRNMRCLASHLLANSGNLLTSTDLPVLSGGVTVDRVWRDYRLFIWDPQDPERGDPHIPAQVEAAS